MTKVKEIYENILTKKRGSGRIMKLSRKGGRIQPCEVDKKNEEIFKNLLTKRKRCDIIAKLPPKRQRSRVEREAGQKNF